MSLPLSLHSGICEPEDLKYSVLSLAHASQRGAAFSYNSLHNNVCEQDKTAWRRTYTIA